MRDVSQWQREMHCGRRGYELSASTSQGSPNLSPGQQFARGSALSPAAYGLESRSELVGVHRQTHGRRHHSNFGHGDESAPRSIQDGAYVCEPHEVDLTLRFFVRGLACMLQDRQIERVHGETALVTPAPPPSSPA